MSLVVTGFKQFIKGAYHSLITFTALLMHSQEVNNEHIYAEAGASSEGVTVTADEMSHSYEVVSFC